ncbi:hypothetical protein Nepgr_008496 [Nepenthes gracilis]|uniref:WRKY domain-containing protein n=1 Tax=Nepenthes gracilis TaxID=150966 RepID=A0AAD3S961_NEPGR|nr:hypothetical protein Nepgr_008496 [Nepenthes gracilis]
MLNQGLIENQGMMMLSSEMGFYPNPTNFTFLPPILSSTTSQQFFKPLSMASSLAADPASNLTQALLSCSPTPKPTQESASSASAKMRASQLLSHQRSTPHLWTWGEGTAQLCLAAGKKSSSIDDHRSLGVSAMKMKKVKARRKVREPRFCFKTMSDVDVLDDGYKWRKYGQKVVKNTQHPRSYYRCTQDDCRVKKRVERLAEDPRMVITTYEGRHAHSPSHDRDEPQEPETKEEILLFFEQLVKCLKRSLHRDLIKPFIDSSVLRSPADTPLTLLLEVDIKRVVFGFGNFKDPSLDKSTAFSKAFCVYMGPSSQLQ